MLKSSRGFTGFDHVKFLTCCLFLKWTQYIFQLQMKIYWNFLYVRIRKDICKWKHWVNIGYLIWIVTWLNRVKHLRNIYVREIQNSKKKVEIEINYFGHCSKYIDISLLYIQIRLKSATNCLNFFRAIAKKF